MGLCKYRRMGGEATERNKSIRVIGALEKVMKGRNVSMEIHKSVRNSFILPPLLWRLNFAWLSQIHASQIRYIKGACNLSSWNRYFNVDVFYHFCMNVTAKRVVCGEVEWVRLELWDFLHSVSCFLLTLEISSIQKNAL